MEPARLDQFRRRLETERADANRRIAERQATAETAVNPDDDMEDQASEAHEADVALTIAERQTDRYAAVDAALDRLARGEYGVCADCEEEIPLARLEAEPTALRCVACQERYEAEPAPTL